MGAESLATLTERSINHGSRIKTMEDTIVDHMDEEATIQRQVNDRLHELEVDQVNGFNELKTQLSNYRWLVIGITSAVSFGITTTLFLMKVLS